MWWIVMHAESEGPGLLEAELRARALEYRIINAFRGDSFPDIRGGVVSGVIVLGGAMNVDETDQYPFLLSERQWLCSALDAGIPTLGICLGAQLIARALGAPVVKNEQKEIGFDAIELTAEGSRDPIFEGVPARFDVFHWHGDRFELPPGTILLSGSARCRHQALRVGRVAYGFQFHLEITSEMIDEWTDAAPDELRSAHTDRETILSASRARLADVHTQARRIFANYFDKIVGYRGTEARRNSKELF